MTRVWKFEKAKRNFATVVEQALTQGPQTITQDGEESVVVLSYKEYRRMVTNQMNIVEFFRNSPLVGDKLDLRRSRN